MSWWCTAEYHTSLCARPYRRQKIKCIIRPPRTLLNQWMSFLVLVILPIRNVWRFSQHRRLAVCFWLYMHTGWWWWHLWLRSLCFEASRSRCIQSLIKCFKCQCSSSLCLSPRTTRSTSLYIGITSRSRHIGLWEWSTYLQRYQNVIHLIRQCCYDWFHRVWKELGKSKRLTSVASQRGWLRGLEIREGGLIKS